MQAAFLVATLCISGRTHTATTAAVAVYGSTPGAIMAAVSAARLIKQMANGTSSAAPQDVILVDPAQRIGGMSAGGLGRSDIGNPVVIGGLAHEFFLRVAKTYDDCNVSECEPQYMLEPHIAERVFTEMIAEAGVIHMKARGAIIAAPVADGKITQIELGDGTIVGDASTIYIDGSYEGDMMAATKAISYTYGREPRTKYNESYAGRREPFSAMDHAPISPFDSSGNLPPYWQAGVTEVYATPVGAGDKKVQAYNFRLCVTTNTSNAVPFPKPIGYNRSEWSLVYKLAASAGGGNLKRFLNNFGALPNKKFDLNNGGVLSTDCAGCSWYYPDSNYTYRRTIYNMHKRYQQGFLWTLANDKAIPATLQAELNKYGQYSRAPTQPN